MDDSLLIGPDGLEAPILAGISAAKHTIDVMVYELTRASVLEALRDAYQRGVVVRVMLDGRLPENVGSISYLSERGPEVILAPEHFPHAHAKYLIFDGFRAIVMSANLNDYSMESERNFAAVIRNPDEIRSLQAVFEADRSGDIVPELPSRLLVSPGRGRQRLHTLLRGAVRRVDLAVMYANDPEILGILADCHARGCALRVLLADPVWMPSNVATADMLGALGIPVRFLRTFELHAKLVLVDHAALVGSHNLSLSSLDHNREVGVVLRGLSAKAAGDQFEFDWASATG